MQSKGMVQTGHPLREDVSWNITSLFFHHTCISHPLREDVSWNTRDRFSQFPARSHPLREDVSWNVKSGCSYTARVVILFVRMWVEINTVINAVATVGSSSSWGCELKCCWKNECDFDFGHPLREDVSWNTFSESAFPWTDAVILFVRMWVEILNTQQLKNIWLSSSSWGCELK